MVPLNEFRYNPDLKIGDTVEVYIENQEDKKGQLVLSHRKARATRSWDRVNAALEQNITIRKNRVTAESTQIDVKTAKARLKKYKLDFHIPYTETVSNPQFDTVYPHKLLIYLA